MQLGLVPVLDIDSTTNEYNPIEATALHDWIVEPIHTILLLDPSQVLLDKFKCYPNNPSFWSSTLITRLRVNVPLFIRRSIKTVGMVEKLFCGILINHCLTFLGN